MVALPKRYGGEAVSVHLRLALLLVGLAGALCAQRTWFAGALGGVATLSADGRSAVNANPSRVSLYKPENGPALNIFGGRYLGNYFGIQGNYLWNRNELTLTSLVTGSAATGYYEQSRNSNQHRLSVDLLVYFRSLRSRIRPYLSIGGGVARFSSDSKSLAVAGAFPEPPLIHFRSTAPAVRFTVGIDLAVGAGWAFRYSFSESIRENPVSRHLSPPGQRNLAIFENLFGFVKFF